MVEARWPKVRAVPDVRPLVPLSSKYAENVTMNRMVQGGRRRRPYLSWSPGPRVNHLVPLARRGPPARRSARDVGLFRQLRPLRLPLGDPEADVLAESRHLASKRLADFVVVADLQPQLAIALVLRRAGPAEDVHRADVPLVEGRLGFVACRWLSGEALDPHLAVADVELLLLEDALDRADPWAVGALADVLELVAGAPIHAEVEEHEVGPGVDRVIEEVHAVLGRHLAGRLEPRAARDPVHHRLLEAATHRSSSVTFVPPRERPCLRSAGSCAGAPASRRR